MTIGERLREERERLGLSQPKFAALAGTTKQTLFSWESGKTAPDGVQLALFGEAGVDVRFVVMGSRDAPAADVLSADERELLSLFRAAPLGVKAAAIGALQGGLSGAVQQHGLTFSNNSPGGVQVGYVAGKSTVIHKSRK